MRLERQVAISYAVGTSAFRRRSALLTAQVTLWRALGASVVIFVFGAYLHSRTMHMCFGGSQADKTQIKVTRFAFEAYPSWAAETNHISCPSSLRDLTEHANAQSTLDPWGTELEMKCGYQPGGSIHGIYVRSAGPDKRFDTPDDISSNDTRY